MRNEPGDDRGGTNDHASSLFHSQTSFICPAWERNSGARLTPQVLTGSVWTTVSGRVTPRRFLPSSSVFFSRTVDGSVLCLTRFSLVLVNVCDFYLFHLMLLCWCAASFSIHNCCVHAAELGLVGLFCFFFPFFFFNKQHFRTSSFERVPWFFSWNITA